MAYRSTNRNSDFILASGWTGSAKSSVLGVVGADILSVAPANRIARTLHMSVHKTSNTQILHICSNVQVVVSLVQDVVPGGVRSIISCQRDEVCDRPDSTEDPPQCVASFSNSKATSVTF